MIKSISLVYFMFLLITHQINGNLIKRLSKKIVSLGIYVTEYR